MLKRLICTCTAVACLGFTGAVASSQEVIHAMTGTIKWVDSTHKTFTLLRDNHSQVTFKDMTDSNVRFTSDKKIFSDATAAHVFDEKGAYVIVFYYGLNPTAVAVEALGQGPFTSTVGTVASVDDKDQMISVKDKSGAIQRYKIGADTVAEGEMGVVEGLKLHTEKGDHIRVVGSASSKEPTALFVNEM